MKTAPNVARCTPTRPTITVKDPTSHDTVFYLDNLSFPVTHDRDTLLPLFFSNQMPEGMGWEA